MQLIPIKRVHVILLTLFFANYNQAISLSVILSNDAICLKLNFIDFIDKQISKTFENIDTRKVHTKRTAPTKLDYVLWRFLILDSGSFNVLKHDTHKKSIRFVQVSSSLRIFENRLSRFCKTL